MMSAEKQEQTEERFLAGRKKAMALLNHNDRTEWELRDRMKRSGYEEDVIEDAIAYVESFHYIDDKRYAMRFAEIYCESRSIQRIRQDLQKRHVSEEYITLALENINWDDSAALQKEIHKLVKKEMTADDSISYEEKQKIAAKLYRKGFRTEDIFRELDSLS
ncbi:MAG: RecX family transcriptional regulator [Butyribacter sp.]|nr:RecX family transcriptional regulator [bacterium]MDY3853785.1 RecX family transcriptional regulator [Butyribacter sp.]